MVTNGSIFIRRGLFLILSTLLVIGQVVAQERGGGQAQFFCLNSQVNPDNDTNDSAPIVLEDYIVWIGANAGDSEVFTINRETGAFEQLTDDDMDDSDLQGDGEYIVWRFKNPLNGTWDIALHHLPTGATLLFGNQDVDDLNPMLEGDYVVWTWDGEPSKIRYYNIATTDTGTIGLGMINERNFAYGIDKGRILYGYTNYLNETTTHSYLYVYDIALNKITLVSESLPSTDLKYNARIHNDMVVWESRPDGLDGSATEIYSYNLETDTFTRITDNNHFDRNPVVSDSHIAYIRQQASTYEVRLYNLLDGLDNLVSTGVFYGVFIGEQMLAVKSNDGIYAYSLEAREFTKIADEYDENARLVLVDNRVFWVGNEEGGTGDTDIFMADCGFVPTIVAQPEDVEIEVGGIATLSVEAQGAGTLSYQWYEGYAGDTTAPVAGATSATFNTPVLFESTHFWVEVSNLYGKWNSLDAEVIVNEALATATPTLTPTPIIPGSIQILPNTSFEMDADNNKIPDGWSAKGTTVNKADKLKRNKLNSDGTMKQFAYSGESAFMFKGNPDGTKSKIGYKLTDFGVITDGTVLEFSVYVNRFNVAPGTTIGRVKIRFSDGSKETLQLTTPTEQVYTSVTDTLLVDLDGRTIEKLKVEFSTNITGGKFMIDAASLLVIPSGLLDTGLVPLP
jgi:hypothetical protein